MGLFAPKSKNGDHSILYLGCTEDHECQKPGKVHGTLSTGEEVCSREQARNILRMNVGDNYETSSRCDLVLKQIEQEQLAATDVEADQQLLALTNEWNQFKIMAAADEEARALVTDMTAHEYISINTVTQVAATTIAA